jgi:hypothetical protein
MENRYSIGFALQHSNGGTPVPPPSDPVPLPVPAPDPTPLTIPGSSPSHIATIDHTGTMTPVTGSTDDHVSPPPKEMSKTRAQTLDIAMSLPWIPSYLYLTAYGERFKSFSGHDNQPKMFENPDSIDRVVSASQFNLPQIFPSRSAAELDALGLWQSPPGGGRMTSDSLIRMGRRVLQEGVKESYRDKLVPRREVGLSPLPSRWVKHDVEQTVSIDAEGCKAEFSGSKTPSHSTVTIRTNHSIPPLCGVYYYEVEVLAHGPDEVLSIGLCDAEAGLTKIPGFDLRTWGYHGDDGRITACQGPTKGFGPKVAVGDVIGCGINFSKNTVFYTKNGLPLGIAFQDVRGVLYPCIGMKSGESVQTNFGNDEFRFDIEKYVHDEKRGVIKDIEAHNSSDDESEFIKNLVASYFSHVGFLETAQMFDRERLIEDAVITEGPIGDAMDVDEQDESDKSKATMDVMNRRRIRACVLDGDIDGASKLLNVFYPTVLEDNYLINFKLRCRKFVELVRRSIPKTDAMTDAGPSETRDGVASAIEYGQQLRQDYKDDNTPYVVDTLSTIFSLLAYEDPSVSRELAYLLDKDELLPLAEELNSAILVSQGKPSVPSLQKLAQHATQIVWELSDQGFNTANLINVKDDFLE